MKKTVTPYKDSKDGKKEQVATMFDNIAPKYDLLNRVLSMGIDVSWRKKVKKMLHQNSVNNILDIATGTGDLAITLHKPGIKITGLDISEGMLEVGREKLKERGIDNDVNFILGDAEEMPFPDNHFDAITVAFGVRNFANLEKGLKEIHRVLKPGGFLYVLEFSQPTTTPFKQFYNFYSTKILPGIGKMVSKDDSAYTYLPESVAAFPFGQEFLDIMTNCGYLEPKCRPLTMGIASIYSGTKQ
ncbi:MAG: bifunctional demethylmenaquinone methyltransferase/2-methoxy-6-polyprenyl-1,4-benzoquinol methylase UbiE [Flavobacteriales bacterium]|nr:bifunctional demethylmenaquinone methyltransferase/2-methoxy-6-polyprenyl-1,4-benzoquinol methylase UbiE [Flavobacteriales bacterium]